MTPRARAAAALALTAGAVVARALVIEPSRLRVREVELAPPGWPPTLDGLRVALVSDLHTGAPFVRERAVERVVARVHAARPDLVCLLGDFVDPTVTGARPIAPSTVARRLAALHAPLGVVAVLGNHDWEHTGHGMRAALLEADIPVLEDEARELAGAGRSLWVVGLADATTRAPDVPAAFARVPPGVPLLCLTHDPDLFPHVPARVALTVAGHTHGGQVNLPWLRARAIPSRYGDRYAGGHVVEGGRHLYVSRGIGTSRWPVRLGAPPELPVLTLRAA